MNYLLKGGRVINPAEQFDGLMDVLIEEGKIAKIGKKITAKDAKVMDMTGLVITPGLIDMHVHLRDPGLEAKEDMASGTRAAAAGGFTTIACMPNTKPIVDSSIVVEGILRRAAVEGLVHVAVIGSVSKGESGKELAEIGDMILSGAVAISDDGIYINQANLLKTGMEYTSMFDRIFITHAEEKSLVEEGVMHEGKISAKLGLKGRPSIAEDIAVARNIMLAEYTDTRLHIAHVSSRESVELIRQAKARGVKVTAEATPHHLALTDEAVLTFSTAAKVCPPLRSAEHVQAVRQGLLDGTIDAIATDHAPHAFEEKDCEYNDAPNGFAGLETALGVVLTELYHTKLMSLMDIVNKMSVAPAQLLNLKAGVLKVGASADITIINPELSWTVDSTGFYTKGKSTPFEGRKLIGKAVGTFVGGRLMMEQGNVLSE
ncbi:dihydroorotase [Sporomusaceae bacterium BoRhaA]|uniref:dihydroorotase n=1 Tax=Pelorhabdus rhamnosifermentans TaxID=2772457 RepID=UPI001C0621B7|nr:dihydroorotase [Pelorhabdus rhamnosifermentans]MBU2702457.1 dihydroorotase [Pelorhabdus rhamnosifermentans]